MSPWFHYKFVERFSLYRFVDRFSHYAFVDIDGDTAEMRISVCLIADLLLYFIFYMENYRASLF